MCLLCCVEEMTCVCGQSFEEMNRPVQDTHDELEEDLTLHFSLRDVKRALGEIRERLDDISYGQVHHRGSGEMFLSVKDFSLSSQSHMFLSGGMKRESSESVVT